MSPGAGFPPPACPAGCPGFLARGARFGCPLRPWPTRTDPGWSGRGRGWAAGRSEEVLPIVLAVRSFGQVQGEVAAAVPGRPGRQRRSGRGGWWRTGLTREFILDHAYLAYPAGLCPGNHRILLSERAAKTTKLLLDHMAQGDQRVRRAHLPGHAPPCSIAAAVVGLADSTAPQSANVRSRLTRCALCCLFPGGNVSQLRIEPA